MSLWEPLGAAFGLWRAALTRAWGALAVYAGVYVLGLLLPLPPLALAGLIVVELLVWAMASGALMRLALADLHPDDPLYRLGPAGLQWGAVEGRLLAARALLVLLLFMILVAAVFCMMLAAVVVSAVAGPAPKLAAGGPPTPAAIAILLVGLAFAAVTVWVCIRLGLSSPASADRLRVQAFSTWSLTRGARSLKLLAFLPALILAAFALGFLVRWAARCGILPPAVLPVVWIAYAIFVGFIETPLAAGVSANAYLRLRAGPAPAAAHN
jgi:hypothetical protein